MGKCDKSYKNKKSKRLRNWTSGGCDLALGMQASCCEKVMILLILRRMREAGPADFWGKSRGLQRK